MKMLMLLHGNPLDGREFDPLFEGLAENFQLVKHIRPLKGAKLEPLIQSINATAKVSGGGSFGILAYSWGAYLALAYMRRYPENVTRALFINPLVVKKQSPGKLNRVLFSFPLLGKVYLKVRRKKLALEYLKNVFLPGSPPKDIHDELKSYLANGTLWKSAARYKKLIFKNPIPPDLQGIQVPTHAILGEKDVIASPEDQLLLLNNLGQFSSEIIPHVGHSLPWTHSDYILQKAKKFFQE